MPRPKKKTIVTIPKDVNDPNMSRTIVNPYVRELFELSLKMGGVEVVSSGETLYDAISTLKRPTKIFLKGVLTVTQGEKKAEVLLNPVRIKRLFYKVCWHQLSKQLTLLLK